ncbi:MAG: tRNA (guanine-N(7)-)-methyltransferase [Candidatus Heimdallarchaeota archaeon LC_3]|nr:MAG: tRNA (guanine-N(7)-)-methyltransferase [Candidatus Heimdallarchaeota archaeon LC_3]
MKEIERLKEIVQKGMVRNPNNTKYPIKDFIDQYRLQLKDLLDFLIREQFFNRNDIVLEIGMGTGTFTSLIAPLVQWIITCETDEEHVMESVQTIDYFQLKNVTLFWGTVEDFNYDGLKVTFPNEQFDKIVAQGSFRNAEDIETFILMSKKLLKKGGKIMLSYNPYYFLTGERKLPEREKLSRNIYLRRKDKPEISFENIITELTLQAEFVKYEKFSMPEESYIELAKFSERDKIDLIREKGHIYPMRTVIIHENSNNSQ